MKPIPTSVHTSNTNTEIAIISNASGTLQNSKVVSPDLNSIINLTISKAETVLLENRIPTTAVYDVAAYILRKLGAMSAMKLQKLVYYSQAWSLIWDDQCLFNNRVEAWANGPVVPDLYSQHRNQFKVSEIVLGDPERLTETQTETIDKVLEFYGDKSPQWLSDLTHQENPWLEARRGLASGQRGNQEITQAAMAEYYGSL
jgi:uncharacterized phage-associated protein